MTDISEIADKLQQRDQIEQKLVPYFDLFKEASSRAVNAENLLSSHRKDAQSASENTVEASDTNCVQSAVVNKDDDLVERLKSSRAAMEERLNLIQSQLDQAQERLRAINEEKYLKLHAVEGLHDEILALTMQLNLSEEKRKKLQNDLGR